MFQENSTISFTNIFHLGSTASTNMSDISRPCFCHPQRLSAPPGSDITHTPLRPPRVFSEARYDNVKSEDVKTKNNTNKPV